MDDARRAGVAIRQQLRAAERSIDEGLIATATLTATLLTARLSMGLAAHAERELITEAGAILSDRLEHRARMLAHHDRYHNLAREMGFGDLGDSAESSADFAAGDNVHAIAA